jgi:hypothetical protein
MSEIMNHPNTTSEEWNVARRIIYGAAIRAGYDHSTADDLTQTALDRILFRNHAKRCPASARIAAAWEVRACRRYGWARLMPRAQRTRGDEQTRAVELATMAIYRERAFNLTPLQMAATADGWGSLQQAAATRAAGAESALDAVLASQGIGPTAAVHEPYTTPSLYGTGPGTAPPTRGLPAQPGDGTEHRPMRDGDRWATHGRA